MGSVVVAAEDDAARTGFSRQIYGRGDCDSAIRVAQRYQTDGPESPEEQEEQQRRMASPPKDRYWLAWFIFCLLGMGCLLPWNFFISGERKIRKMAERKRSISISFPSVRLLDVQVPKRIGHQLCLGQHDERRPHAAPKEVELVSLHRFHDSQCDLPATQRRFRTPLQVLMHAALLENFC